MEQVSRFLEEHDGPASQKQLLAGVSGNDKTVLRALECLCQEGKARVDPGARGAKLAVSVEPFRDVARAKLPISDPDSWSS
jgi:hypothetical protein